LNIRASWFFQDLTRRYPISYHLGLKSLAHRRERRLRCSWRTKVAEEIKVGAR
jgi:hypothetical protein